MEKIAISCEVTIGKKLCADYFNNITCRVMQLTIICVILNGCFSLATNIKHELKAQNMKQTLNAKDRKNGKKLYDCNKKKLNNYL